jgi:hypothetical protein
MATVKIHEGTKFETTVDLQDDEGIIFIVPSKHRFARMVSLGCTKGTKLYYGNLVITDKRVITIPHPPNKKNYPADSYYFKDIAGARAVKQAQASQEAAAAEFTINMKPGQTSSCTEIGKSYIYYEVNLKNFLTAMSAASDEKAAKDAKLSFFGEAVMGESVGKKTFDMRARAIKRANNLDFSSAGHAKIRDYIVDLINDCAAEAAAG